MPTKCSKANDRTIVLTYLFVGTVLGGLFYNPADIPSYIQGSLGVINGVNIYTLQGVVYPPPLYLFAATVFKIVGLHFNLTPSSYVAISVFACICAVTQSFVYLLGSKVVAPRNNNKWVLAALFNPFVIYVSFLYGQMESFVILGVAGVIYGDIKEQWAIGGAALAVATSVKLYPVVLFLPYIYHNWENAARIIKGAAPIGVLTTILMTLYLPQSLTIFSSASGVVRPVNAIYLASLSFSPKWLVTGLFLLTFMASTCVSLLMEKEPVRYLIPLVPVVLFYPNILEYRWLPLAVGSLLIGYLPTQDGISRLCRVYGWLWTLFGTLAMITGTIEGWYEGKLWVVSTFHSLPQLPIVFGVWSHSFESILTSPVLFELVVLRGLRTAIAIIFIITVIIWCKRVKEKH